MIIFAVPFAFAAVLGGFGLCLGGAVGTVIRLFQLLTLRGRLVQALKDAQPELLERMKTSGFSTWLGLHRELMRLPQEIEQIDTNQWGKDAREYARTFNAFVLCLRYIVLGTVFMLSGLGLVAWSARQFDF